MSNPRGTFTATIAGKERQLALTLGAMAEIEDSLKLETVNDAFLRIRQGSIKTMIVVLKAMAKAGGAALTDADVDAIDPREITEILTKAFEAAFPAPDEEDDPGSGSGTGQEKKA